MSDLASRLMAAAERLRRATSAMCFAAPITHVYNPLEYAWSLHRSYLQRARPTCEVLFLGMNPGPWGMAQCGVPFGEVGLVRDWLKIRGQVDSPRKPHPKRPIEGLACKRSEVSGARLWGLMRDRFGTPTKFFRTNLVVNYCPLVFMEASGRNFTPDKLPAATRDALELVCDEHLSAVIAAIGCPTLVGVGAFAERCLRRVADSSGYDGKIVRVLHPSPASPAANRDWAGQVTATLRSAGVWT